MANERPSEHELPRPPRPEEPKQEKKEPEHKGWRLVSDILTIIAFAILIAIAIWGLVHLAELIASSFSSNSPTPSIQVSAPSEATSGQPITISWSYPEAGAGSYAFLYQCQDGLSFGMGGAASSSIPCGIAYTIGTLPNGGQAASSSVSLVPTLSGNASVTDTISIIFIPQTGTSQAHGDATITVIPASKTTKPSTPSKPAQTKTKPATAPTAPRYRGPADLSVRIVSGSVDASGAATVVFDISNVGGSSSGSYEFSAQLPTAQPYPYQSAPQAPLSPGAHIENTLRFTDVASGGGLFSVSILDGSESNATNDYASMELSAPYTNYSNYNSYPSAPYVYPTTYSTY